MHARCIRTRDQLSIAFVGTLAAVFTPSCARHKHNTTTTEVPVPQVSVEQSKPIVWPRAGAPEFTFEYKSQGGPFFGIDIAERDWTLTIDSRRAECVVDRHRSDAETPGEPIGLFRFELTDDELIALQKLVENSKLPALKPASKGNPGSSLQTIDWWSPSGRNTVRFDSTDRVLSGQIWPLMEKVFELLSRALQHPQAAIRVETSLTQSPAGPRLSLRLLNVGTARLCLNDPRIGLDAPQRMALVRVALKPVQKPGFTPTRPQWVDLNLTREKYNPKDPAPALTFLDPGSALEVGPIPWPSAPRGVPHLIHGFWSDYGRENDTKGTYQVRGAATSKWVEVTP